MNLRLLCSFQDGDHEIASAVFGRNQKKGKKSKGKKIAT